MSKRKPIEIIKNNNIPLIKMEDEMSTFAQFQENIMAQVIDRKDEEYSNFLVNQIVSFMKENNVSTCFILNKEELIDCLKEHNKLHQEIMFLQSQLDQANERLNGAIVAPVKVNQNIYIIYNGEVERRVVHKITIGLKGVNINAVLYKKYGSYWCNRKFSTFNKTWWLTKEEAEKKLQELRGGE